MTAHQLKLDTSIQASFGKPDDPDYIFDIVTNADQSTMAVTLSTNAIKLYDPGTGSFKFELLRHTGTITGLTFPEPSSPFLLCSSSADGTIVIWDLRESRHMKAVLKTPKSDEIWSLGVGGTNSSLVAGGTDTKVLLWDFRSGKLMAEWEEWHHEPVTQTLFNPIKKAQLVTGSVDGLINVIDTSGPLDSEDIIEHQTMSPGTSIAKIGFFGKDYGKIWILTHIETLSIWNLDSSLEEAKFGDTRAIASHKWSLPAVNYLVNCHSSPGTDSLWLAAGTSSGSVGYFPVEFAERGESMPSMGTLSDVAAVLHGGHSDVVRTIWLNENQGSLQPGPFCWSGGEDGKLCCWSQNGSVERGHSWVSSKLVLKKNSSLKNNRRMPY